MRKSVNSRLASSVFAILVIIVAIFAAVSYVPAAKAFHGDWIYFTAKVQNAKTPAIDVTDDCTGFYENATEASDTYVVMFEEAKTTIRQNLSQYSNLLWERFDNTGLKACNIIERDEHDKATLAFFEPDTNTVYLVEEKLDILREQVGYAAAREVVAHELIHALSTTDTNKNTPLLEGFTEYMAQSIYPTYIPAYLYHYAFVEAVVIDIGLEASIDAFMAGTLEDVIEKAIDKPGAMNSIWMRLHNSAIELAPDADERIILDVYTHYLQTLQLSEYPDSYTFMIHFLDNTKDNAVAIQYFEDVLSTPPTAATNEMVAAFSCPKKDASLSTSVPDKKILIRRSF